MPSKRYRLKLEHPYAEKGTIIEEESQEYDAYSPFDAISLRSKDCSFYIPRSKAHLWLEEVKEVTFTKEQAEAIRAQLKAGKELSFNHWLTAHTSTEE